MLPFPETVSNFVCKFKGSFHSTNWTEKYRRVHTWRHSCRLVNSSLQPLFNSIAVASAGFEFLAIGQAKQKLAVVQGNEFPDSGSLHDR